MNVNLGSTHPAGAVTTYPGGVRQHGDPNPELNSAPSAEEEETPVKIHHPVTQPATDVEAGRPDIGTE